MVRTPTPIPAMSRPIYSIVMTTPAVWMTPPTRKMQQASNMVFRLPRGSEYDARNAPQKQPAVNNATTVPERGSAFFRRKLALKESEATTSAITPLDKFQHSNGDKSRSALTDHIRREMSRWLQSNQSGIGRYLTSWLPKSCKRDRRSSRISEVHMNQW
jgi:hypothetical protein